MVSADSLISALHLSRVLVIGDIMLDRYWFGGVERISPEAPVPVVLVDEVENRLGGAGNVALNITSLGGKCTLIGVVGDDKAGEDVIDIAASAGVTPNIFKDQSMPTCIKQRIISRNQQLLRADFESRPDETMYPELERKYAELVAEHDAIVLSDYGKGTLGKVESLISIATDQNIPVLVDPKGSDFSRYRGASLITPNLKEFEQVSGEVESDDDLALKAETVIRDNNLDALLVTLSEKGMKLFQANKNTIHRPARSQEVFDVSGAGDTVIATMALCMASKLDMSESLMVANNAAGVVVSKIGTATVDTSELLNAIKAEAVQ